MRSQYAPPLKMLVLTLLFIAVSLAIMPTEPLMAQSCGAGEQTHRIASGETLFRIANRYGVTMDAIAVRNGISDYTRIFAGTTLCIPAGAVVPGNQTIVQIIVVTATPSASPVSTNTTTTTQVQPGQENWCNAGGPWGDGRCIVPGNPFLQDYWFLAGWCNAQVQLGNYQGTVDNCLNGVTGMTNNPIATTITTFNYDLVDDDEEFNCTIIYDKDTGHVTSLARWDDDYEDQSQVIFFTNLPNLENYAVSLGEDDEKAGINKVTDPYKTFTLAVAKLSIRDDESKEIDRIGPTRCDRIET